MCRICPGQWFKLKTSHYWYHMQFTHGIDSQTKQNYPFPKKLNNINPKHYHVEKRGKRGRPRKVITKNQRNQKNQNQKSHEHRESKVKRYFEDDNYQVKGKSKIKVEEDNENNNNLNNNNYYEDEENEEDDEEEEEEEEMNVARCEVCSRLISFDSIESPGDVWFKHMYRCIPRPQSNNLINYRNSQKFIQSSKLKE